MFLLICGCFCVLSPNWDTKILYTLPSYYVNPLGGVSFGHRTRVIGEKPDYVDQSTFFYERNGSFRIACPYSASFTEGRHHYSLPKDVVFNWSTFVSFTPDTMYIPTAGVFMMRSLTITVTNIMDDEPIEIVDAESTSRNIFVVAVLPITLKRNESMTVRVVLIPSTPGFSSEIILIKTSKGTVPYHFVMRATQTSKDITIPTFYHHSNTMLSNLSFRVPPVIGAKRRSVLFDSMVFNTTLSGCTGRFVQLGLKDLNPGFYLTQCHLITAQASRSIPIVLYVAKGPLLSYYPVIFLDTVTDPGGQVEADLKLVNPTDIPFTILSISLSDDSPSDVTVKAMPSPIVLEGQCHDVIGTVIASGARRGDFDAKVVVTYEGGSDSNPKTLEIPVKGYVEYGSLEPSQSKIEVFTSSEKQTFKIHFTNRFSVPLAILGVRTESIWLMVVGFRPRVVQPGERSDDILVKYKQVDFESFETVLIVETNITTLHIPIQVFRQQMMISSNPDNFTGEGKLFYSFRKVFCGASTTLTLYVKNPNPIPCEITHFKTSPGIYVSGFWNANNPKLRSHTIGPYGQHVISLKIGFATVQMAHRERNDTVTFGGPGSSVSIVISWIPYSGHLKGTSSLPSVVHPGRMYNGSLYLNSTYDLSARVRNLSTNLKFFHLNCSGKAPLITKGSLANVGTFRVMFTPDALEQTRIGYVFKDWRNITYQLEAWRELFESSNSFSMSFFLHLRKQIVLRATLDVLINGTFFFNTSARTGQVLPYTNVAVKVEVRSRFDTWIGFHGETFDAAIGPHETAVLEFPYTVGGPGRFSYLYPISTNLTAPFFCNISGTVVKPRVKFMNSAGSRLKNAVFVLEAPPSGGSWKRQFFLKNFGKSPVSVGPFSSSSELLSIETDCEETLYGQFSCAVNISVLAKFLKDPFEEANVTVLVQKIPVVLGISVAQTDRMLRLVKVKKVMEAIGWVILAFGVHILELVWSIRMHYKAKREFRARTEKLRSLLGDLNVTAHDRNVSHDRNPGNIRRMVFDNRPQNEMEQYFWNTRDLR